MAPSGDLTEMEPAERSARPGPADLQLTISASSMHSAARREIRSPGPEIRNQSEITERGRAPPGNPVTSCQAFRRLWHESNGLATLAGLRQGSTVLPAALRRLNGGFFMVVLLFRSVCHVLLIIHANDGTSKHLPATWISSQCSPGIRELLAGTPRQGVRLEGGPEASVSPPYLPSQGLEGRLLQEPRSDFDGALGVCCSL